MKYSDRSKFPPVDFQNGIYVNGQVPLDERDVASKIEDLFVSTTNRGEETLYKRAYVGMQVTIANPSTNEFEVLVCTNADPYTPGNSATTVNAQNYTQYWRSMRTEISPAGGTSGGGAISITSEISPTTGEETFSIGVKVDNDTVKIVNDKLSISLNSRVDNDTIKVISDKLTGGKYKFKRVDEKTLGDGIWASYRLAYKAPGASDYVELTDEQIDIPELDILEEVHICKATYDSSTGKYTETATDPSDPRWDTAAGDVYLHLIWKVTDQDHKGGTTTTETYIKISDMIRVDLSSLMTRVSNLEDASNNVFGPRLNSCDASIVALRQQISDTSSDFNTKLQNTSTYFGGLNDARVQDITNVRSDMATAATAAKTYTDGSINALNNSLTQTISSTKTELQNSISSVQSTLNTKIDNNTDTLNSRIANVSSNQQSTQSSLDSNVSRIDGRLTTIDSSMQEAFTLLDEIQLTVTGYLQNLEDRCTEVNGLAAEVRTLENDVSTQEQVMASSLVEMRKKINELHPGTFSAAPMMRSAAVQGDEVRALSYVETETDNRTIDLTALFETAEGQPADVDLRTIYDSALFIAKGPAQVRVDATFREDSDDTLVLYYDFIDNVGMKRQVIEIGNNDDAVLSVLMKKTVTLAKFR